MLLPVDCPNADRQECRTLVPITKPDLWQMFMILIYIEKLINLYSKLNNFCKICLCSRLIDEKDSVHQL